MAESEAEPVEAHPGYFAGFYDAADLTPIFDDAPVEYRAGWDAYWRCGTALSAGERGEK